MYYILVKDRCEIPCNTEIYGMRGVFFMSYSESIAVILRMWSYLQPGLVPPPQSFSKFWSRMVSSVGPLKCSPFFPEFASVSRMPSPLRTLGCRWPFLELPAWRPSGLVSSCQVLAHILVTSLPKAMAGSCGNWKSRNFESSISSP